MGTCEVCGNSYDKAFSVKMPDGGRIIGHGVDDDATGKIYCCEHCAHA